MISAKTKAQNSKTPIEHLKLAFKHYWTENKFLKDEIDELQSKIKKSSMEVTAEFGDDMVTIMSGADQSMISPFMKFFWQEQQKYLKSSSTEIRYHPMIIRYCLSLAAKLSAAFNEIWYDEKKGAGFLILSSRCRYNLGNLNLLLKIFSTVSLL